MNDLAKYLPPSLMKGGGFELYDWDIQDKEFNVDVIKGTTMDGLPTSMQD